MDRLLSEYTHTKRKGNRSRQPHRTHTTWPSTTRLVVALYNPRSRDRHWQLGIARDLLLEHRPATTPVSLARQLGRSEEEVRLTCLAEMNPDDVDMLTLVLIGNSCTFVSEGRMVTPRGYPGSEMQ